MTERMHKSDNSQIESTNGSPTGIHFPLPMPESHCAVLHIFRDTNEATSTIVQPKHTLGGAFDTQNTLICTADVPSYYSILDLLNFVCPVDPFVKHYRILRDRDLTTYMLLMNFRNSEAAREYYWQYNNRPFTSMEPDVCRVLFVESIEADSTLLAPYSIPFVQTAHYDEDTAPTCPVCLEVMDDRISSLLTILCQHTFHYYCLSKWGDGSCPVCRYSQISTKHNTSISLADSTNSLTADATRCADCGSTQALWVCLICGHAGCGSEKGNHASYHHKESNHPYALGVETQRVWDYVRDGYVHRLVQNMVDGKIVELSSSEHSSFPEDKMESLSMEFSVLLTSQLDSQRMYYEGLVDNLSTQLSLHSNQVKGLLKEFHSSKCMNESIVTQSDGKSKSLDAIVKQKHTLEHQLKAIVKRSDNCRSNLIAEKKLTTRLISSSELLRNGVSEKKAIALELGDQIRDLIFFLEAREKVQEQPELKGGNLSTTGSSTIGRSSGKN